MNQGVVLIGPMGSGKTTLGAMLADRLGMPFVDLDAWLVEQEGRTIPAIFAEDGEDYFRAREAEGLRRWLGQSVVLATGGGVVTRAENRTRLQAHPAVVWLRARPETLARRIGNDPNRPLLHGDKPLERLRRLAEVRDPWYRACAGIVLDTDDQAIAQVLDALLHRLGRSGA